MTFSLNSVPTSDRTGGSVLYEKDLTERVIGAAIELHRSLGPGLLESAYQACLAREFSLRGIAFEQEKPLPVEYKGVKLDCGYRIDLLVEGKVVVELKALDQVAPVHEVQLVSYLRLTGCRVGLLINFHAPTLKRGIVRRVV
jgi:GxxExxY protein